MPGRWTDARRTRRRAAGCIAAAVLWGGARAQSASDPTNLVGFSAGPVVIAPSLTTGYAYNSNVFLNSAEVNTTGDQVLTVEPALQLAVPFSNSVFRVADTLKWTDYQHTPQTAGKTANDALGELILNFGSTDKLGLSAHSITGVAETQAFDPGGEVTFKGNAFQYHTELVSIARENSGARGYRVSVQRNALRFDPDQEVFFFNYRGFDGEAAYLQPLSSNTRLAIGYLGTRYDHFRTEAPDVVDRTEQGDTIYGQLEGRLGPRQPYTVRLGWERLAFTGNDAKDFTGPIGQANFAAIVGGGAVITVRAQSQPFRSFFLTNNFYVFQLIGTQIVRHFPQGSEFGGNFDYFRSSYGEPVPTGSTGEGVYRRDKAVRLEAYASLAFRDRVALRLSVAKNKKYSNYPGADYDAIEVFGGFVFGWN
jgi:hypothetical protein